MNNLAKDRPTPGGRYRYTPAIGGKVREGVVKNIARMRGGVVLAFFEGTNKGFPVTKHGTWELVETLEPVRIPYPY